MIWAFICLSALALSTAATALLVFKLYRDWDVRASSVKWLFAVFFTYHCVCSAARLVYFVWLTVLTEHQEGDGLDGQTLVGTELYRLGISAVLKRAERQSDWVTTAIIVGDTALFGLTIWMTALVYELSKLVAVAMDRGEQHERAKIRCYSWMGHCSIAVFLVVEISLAVAFSGYSTWAYLLLLAVYLLHIAAHIYMVLAVVILKVKGRNYESVHGHFVTSPLYRRLKWIMLVYALFAFQFHFSSVIMYAVPKETERLGSYAGVSFVLYYLRGFVLSVVTGCSQPCVIRCFGCCVPEDIKTLYTQRRECVVSIPGGYDLPYINPVFVFTDIESSSALWAVGDGRIMQQATHIHDDILRGLLVPYRGYEITTAGDSFQLAFHTIQEAVAYCLEAQLELLNAKWPKDLHGLIPATRTVRVATRKIFRGLRVRMGIHDAVGSEGSLVHDVHAVTGKLTYSGASEVIANEIADLGAGGQILVTKRIAERLAENSSQMAIKFVVEPVCEYSIPRLNTMLEVFQVLPKPLALRCASFNSPRHIVSNTHNVSRRVEAREESRLRTESEAFYTIMQFSPSYG